jgi:formyltetrahydrofolate deformylase
MESAVLRLHCPDQKGLVARVSAFVYKHGGNILAVHQHVEDLGNRLFMWIHFGSLDLEGTRDKLEEDFQQIADDLEMVFAFTYSDQRKRMA